MCADFEPIVSSLLRLICVTYSFHYKFVFYFAIIEHENEIQLFAYRLKYRMLPTQALTLYIALNVRVLHIDKNLKFEKRLPLFTVDAGAEESE